MLLLAAVMATTAVATIPASEVRAASHGRPAAANSTIRWGACPETPNAAARDAAQECGTLSVPLDYRQRHGRTLELMVSRIRSAAPQSRRGILLLNPGGPGGSGLDMPSMLKQMMPPEVADRYDLIGFDPRGVGYSTPVTCGIDLVADMDLVLPYPSPDGSIEANIEYAKRTAAGCAEKSGDLLPYITTANTARDLDRIRAALGERKMSYLGFSYGTYLGTAYVSLFPNRADRIILDSAVDPNRVWYDQWRTFSEAVAIRFPDFATYAAAHDDALGFGSTPEAVTKRYFELLAALDEKPVALPEGTITGNLLREATRSQLYDELAFPSLLADWKFVADLVEAGGALPTEASARSRSARSAERIFTTVRGHRLLGVAPMSKAVPHAVSPSGGQFAVAGPTAAAGATAPTVPVDNNVAALYSVVCGDSSWSSDMARYQRNVDADRVAYPLTNGMPANLWPCPFWQNKPIEPPVTVTSKGPRNVLILQNRRDPATPWKTGVALREALGQRAAFVGVDGGDHGLYGRGSCADEAANTFLTTGKLPAQDVFCGQY